MECILYRIVKFILYPLYVIIFHPVAIGRENIPKEGAVVFAGNHRHAFDPVVVMTHTNRFVHYMAKESIVRASDTLNNILNGLATQ